MAEPTLGSGGFAGVNDDPTQGAGPQPTGYTPEQGEKNNAQADAEERRIVDHWWEEWTEAREFDRNFRQQVAIDRKYAAGTADLTWAVSTNVIGAFIDVLTALLYARDPDVSVSRAAQVDDTALELLNGTQIPPESMELFARTLQIVISKLWKKGKLRRACRKGVRSVLSNAEGWFKANLIVDQPPQPMVEQALNDARSTLARLEAQEELLEDPDFQDPELQSAKKDEIKGLIESLQTKIEVSVTRMFFIDFVRTENIQVSTDVSCIDDYLDAEWIGNESFIPKTKVLARFKRLTPEDVKEAAIYYQSQPKKLTNRDTDNILPQGELTAESALAFSQDQGRGEKRGYLHVVEIWDRETKQVRTMVEGVKKWAVEPYEPPFPTSRFYPYFYFAFYEVDGSRHAQSLSWRLYKLQDEYSTARSNFRLTRERSIPGILVNASGLDPEQVRKVEQSKHQEITAIQPNNPEQPIEQLFAPKPVAQVDMRVFETAPITSDMERISGVQEALSAVTQGPGNPQTATEAAIQQQGTSARTTSDRDALEWLLTDLAEYTAEQALQGLSIPDVQRIAGVKAFWPEGMTIEDLFTLLEVSIQAGTTGKPKAQANQAEWAQVLPKLQELQMQIQQALGGGNKPLAQAMINLAKETLRRFHVDVDLDQFVPAMAPPGSPGSGMPPPPLLPKVSVAIKGVIDPATSAALVAPDLQRDQISQPPQPPPGAGQPLPPPGAPPSAAAPPSPPVSGPAPPAGAPIAPHP